MLDTITPIKDMSVKTLVNLVATESVSEVDLFNIASDVMGRDFLPPGVRPFFVEVRNSTKHAAILGCGVPLNYGLMQQEARELLATLS